MLIDVKSILHTPGGELNFRFELDLSDLNFGGRYPISRPVIVEGAVRNRAEVLYLELAAHTTLDAVCDRCGKSFLQEKTVPYTCILAEELQNEENDEIVLLENGQVDAGELAREAFILGMDTKRRQAYTPRWILPEMSCGNPLNRCCPIRICFYTTSRQWIQMSTKPAPEWEMNGFWKTLQGLPTGARTSSSVIPTFRV